MADRNTHKETMEIHSNQKTKDTMAGASPHLSVTTLHVDEPNSPIKRHRGAGWIKIQDPMTCCLQKTHLWVSKVKHRLKVRESR